MPQSVSPKRRDLRGLHRRGSRWNTPGRTLNQIPRAAHLRYSLSDYGASIEYEPRRRERKSFELWLTMTAQSDLEWRKTIPITTPAQKNRKQTIHPQHVQQDPAGHVDSREQQR